MSSTGRVPCQLYGLPGSYECHSVTDMQGDAYYHSMLLMCCRIKNSAQPLTITNWVKVFGHS